MQFWKGCNTKNSLTTATRRFLRMFPRKILVSDSFYTNLQLVTFIVLFRQQIPQAAV